MNRLIIFLDEFTKKDLSHAVIEDEDRYHHVTTHLKLKPGDEIQVVIPSLGLTKARILSDLPNSKRLELKLPPKDQWLQGPKRWIHLVVGLCRPPSARKIIEHGVGFPLKSLSFIQTDLSDKSYLTSSMYKGPLIKHHLNLGLSQCAHYHDLPKVELSKKKLHEFIDPEKKQYVLDFENSQRIDAIKDLNAEKPITLFIGPERGWSLQERSILKQKDLPSISLSAGVHRVEVASLLALGLFENKVSIGVFALHT